MALKEGDFIQLHFTGRTEDGDVFDTTKQDVAQEHGLSQRNVQFEPITMAVGKGFVLDGLDEALVGHEPGDSFTVELPPEKAFGKKRGDLVKLMPLKAFDKQQVKPVPGLELNIDGMHGTVKTVTGNRVIVDFNNPLSGQTLTYDLEIVGTVDDLQDQVGAIASRMLRFEPAVSIDGTSAELTLPLELPEDLQKQLTENITEMTAATKVSFAVDESQSGKA